MIETNFLTSINAVNMELTGKAFKEAIEALKREQIGKMQVATRRRMRNDLYAAHGNPSATTGTKAAQAI
jgi:hypothetical protein